MPDIVQLIQKKRHAFAKFVTPKYATIVLRYFRDGGNTACGRMINSCQVFASCGMFSRTYLDALVLRGLFEARNRCGRASPYGAPCALGCTCIRNSSIRLWQVVASLSSIKDDTFEKKVLIITYNEKIYLLNIIYVYIYIYINN